MITLAILLLLGLALIVFTIISVVVVSLSRYLHWVCDIW